MKSLRTIFQYISRYPKLVISYFSFNVLSTVFSLMSLGLLTPFLLLIFNQTDILKKSDGKAGFPANVLNWFNSLMSQWAETTPGKIRALSAICVIVVISILLKNLFLYLAMYVLNPIRNRIIN